MLWASRFELTVFQSPRICGLATKALQGKCPWDPAAALTVAEVLHLHSIASDRTVSVIDRCGAAHFLGLLYGRARASDVRSVRPLIIDHSGSPSWRDSYIELGTLEHKTSRLDAKRRRILPLVIPGIGIASKPFGKLLLEVRAEAGISNEQTGVPFLPAPTPSGAWSSDPLSSGEVTRWLRCLLPRPPSEKPLSSHSLKVTTLMWCSKFGMLRETKRVLGHHSDAASGSDAVYGRELQSAALREYVLILESVADGRFLPDQTRSGNFAPGWSREAIMNAAAVPPPSSPTAPDVSDDQDDAMAVVSDVSDSDEDEAELPQFWAHPTSQILHRHHIRFCDVLVWSAVRGPLSAHSYCTGANSPAVCEVFSQGWLGLARRQDVLSRCITWLSWRELCCDGMSLSMNFSSQFVFAHRILSSP